LSISAARWRIRAGPQHPAARSIAEERAIARLSKNIAAAAAAGAALICLRLRAISFICARALSPKLTIARAQSFRRGRIAGSRNSAVVTLTFYYARPFKQRKRLGAAAPIPADLRDIK